MNRLLLTQAVKEHAAALSFDCVGITGADDLPAAEAVIISRVADGSMRALPWFDEERARLACRPRSRFPWAKSIICLALAYPSATPAGTQPDAQVAPLRGLISRYAVSTDYHIVIGDSLAQLAKQLRGLGAREVKGYVDTGPVAERALAARAGIGWFGKNTNILTVRRGSWVFLAELFTDLDLEPDVPLRKSCGSCTACIAACPTRALVAPFTLATERCISFLTIEWRGVIPRDLRPQMGRLIFGCDICQEVCPVNLRLAAPAGFGGAEREGLLDMRPLLEMGEADFRRRFGWSALKRAKRLGLQRNAAVALGNAGDRAAVPALAGALANAEPLLRSHIVWALGRLGGTEAANVLNKARMVEPDVSVLEEIAFALDMLREPR